MVIKVMMVTNKMMVVSIMAVAVSLNSNSMEMVECMKMIEGMRMP